MIIPKHVRLRTAADDDSKDIYYAIACGAFLMSICWVTSMVAHFMGWA